MRKALIAAFSVALAFPLPAEEPVWAGRLREAPKRVDLFAMPLVGFRSDVHENLAGAPNTRAKVKTNTGIGVRAGADLPDGTNLGVLYLFSHHRESRRRGKADLHGTFLEWEVPYLKLDLGNVKVENRLGLGAGFGHVDFTRDFDDETDLAAAIRASAAVSLRETIDLNVGAGYFHYGHPGDTLGYGGFLSFGVGIRF